MKFETDIGGAGGVKGITRVPVYNGYHRYDTKEIYWTTATRDRVAIADMDDEHLENTIDYISRRCNGYCAYNKELDFTLIAMMQERTYRGLLKEDDNADLYYV